MNIPVGELLPGQRLLLEGIAKMAEKWRVPEGVSVVEQTFPEFLGQVHDDFMENGDRAYLHRAVWLRRDATAKAWVEWLVAYHLDRRKFEEEFLGAVREAVRLSGEEHPLVQSAFEVFAKVPPITRTLIAVAEGFHPEQTV